MRDEVRRGRLGVANYWIGLEIVVGVRRGRWMTDESMCGG